MGIQRLYSVFELQWSYYTLYKMLMMIWEFVAITASVLQFIFLVTPESKNVNNTIVQNIMFL